VALLPIYLLGQPVLRKKARPVKSPEAALVQLAADMFETMHQASGIGLAANQVGSLQRIIVVDVSGMEGPEEQAPPPPPLALVNPVVVSEEGSWVMEEGCLSIPGVRDEVERAERITVRYRDLEFNEQLLEADGLLARVILHEIDHLDGVLFFDHIGAVKRKLLRGRLNKISKGEVEVDYPVVTDVPQTEQGIPATARV
jgi:peptide deformylase